MGGRGTRSPLNTLSKSMVAWKTSAKRRGVRLSSWWTSERYYRKWVSSSFCIVSLNILYILATTLISWGEDRTFSAQGASVRNLLFQKPS